MGDDDVKLNPDAPAFVPASLQQKPSTPPPSMSPPVYAHPAAPDMEMMALPAEMMAPDMSLPQGGFYMDAFGNTFAADNMTPMGYYETQMGVQPYADGSVDEQTAFYLAQEDAMWSGLYRPPQMPKGNTQGRARGKARW